MKNLRVLIWVLPLALVVYHWSFSSVTAQPARPAQGQPSSATDINLIRAELLLQQLLAQYPTSNKCSDAAYQLGDVYENRRPPQYRRAAVYFERCVQWNPSTQYDARLRAAKVYDRQLRERAKAA